MPGLSFLSVVGLIFVLGFIAWLVLNRSNDIEE